MNHRTINPRLRNLLQRLIITGNNAALIASDPETFSPEQRADVVAAWDEAVAALRETDRAPAPKTQQETDHGTQQHRTP